MIDSYLKYLNEIEEWRQPDFDKAGEKIKDLAGATKKKVKDIIHYLGTIEDMPMEIYRYNNKSIIWVFKKPGERRYFTTWFIIDGNMFKRPRGISRVQVQPRIPIRKKADIIGRSKLIDKGTVSYMGKSPPPKFYNFKGFDTIEDGTEVSMRPAPGSYFKAAWASLPTGMTTLTLTDQSVWFIFQRIK